MSRDEEHRGVSVEMFGQEDTGTTEIAEQKGQRMFS